MIKSKEIARQMAYKSLRKQHGSRLLVITKDQISTATFEGKIYQETGKDNKDALNKLFKIHLLKLDI